MAGQKSSKPERMKDGELPSPSLPLPVGGIDVNFCKNPRCRNFGVQAAQNRDKSPEQATLGDGYQLRKKGSGVLGGYDLICDYCESAIPIKSNTGIAEELARIKRESVPNQAIVACPSKGCVNHQVPVGKGKQFYSKNGKTAAGSQKYICRKCHTKFKEPLRRPHGNERDSYKNKAIFTLIVNRTPIRRICEIESISPGKFYRRLDHIYLKCLAFAAARESALRRIAISRLHLGVDAQYYTVNWASRDVRKSTILGAVCSTDNATRYVLGIHLAYDRQADPVAIHSDAIAKGEDLKPRYLRKYARLWLPDEFRASAARNKGVAPQAYSNIHDSVQAVYRAASEREDIEALDPKSSDEQAPSRGMQTHMDYTLYGHFLYLRSLVGNVEKWRFYLDQDSGMRAACLAAFQPEIAKRTADAFYVRIAKNLSVPEKQKLVKISKDLFAQAKLTYPDKNDEEVRAQMTLENMRRANAFGDFNDIWVDHPAPTMSEPLKAVSYLTDYGDYDEIHLARLINKASIHSTDSFFNQIRRRLSILERPIHSTANAGRVWAGYSAYNPENVGKVLAIFRVFHNYVLLPGREEFLQPDKRTPAMRLGLAKGPVTFEDILYF